MIRIAYLVVAALLISPCSALAQGVDAGVIGAALVTVQPENDYVGNPYLDNGLGGKGPGGSVSVDISSPNGFTVVAEYNSARLKAVQTGRLVGGGPVTTTLHDAMLIGLVGWARGHHHRFTILAGAGRSFGSPSIDGQATADDGASGLVLTVGLNAAHHLSDRVSLVGTARYARVSRSTAVEQLGLGEDVYRFGAGLRFRLN